MSSPSPLELTASGIIQRIEAGEYPDAILGNIAAGFLPLPQDDLIAILAYLATNKSGEIGETAQRSLAEVPLRSISSFAANDALAPEHLEMLMRATTDATILEALIRNRAVRDEAVIELARRAEPGVQEVVVINQARILRASEILDALEANPQLTADTRRRVLETREEFFDKKARQAALLVETDEDEVIEELALDPIADLLEKAVDDDAVAAPLPPPDLTPVEEKDAKKRSVLSQILDMTVSQKVKLGFKGGKTERGILVRDRNRLVCSAVMRNPRITETEVEAIAAMRNVDDEVLRLISMRREWMAKYSIVITLCRNPKAPLGVVLPVINRLTLRDLKGLKDDKGVPEVVRASARKLFAQRSQKS